MAFYNLQPPQASIIDNHFPVFEESIYDLKIRDERTFLNNTNCKENLMNSYGSNNEIESKENNYQTDSYKRFYENPFESRLRRKPDIIPNQNMFIDVVKSKFFN